MGSVPKPAPLSPYHFAERIKYLKEKGMPLNMKNIDPKLCRALSITPILLFSLGISVVLAVLSFSILFLLGA